MSLKQTDRRSLASDASSSLAKACNHLARRQAEDGSWRGDYSGPAFLLPMYVTLCHISGQTVPAGRAKKMCTHIRRSLNPDGGIGLYIGGPGCVFTSCLGYVALRLLGESASDPDAARLREWIRAHGSPLESASWGKFVLSTLGLYEYDGLHPVAPELWLLPHRAPIHPGRLWCHARQVYLPMAWLYRRRAVGPITPLILDLRGELYDGRYGDIRWSRHRSRVNASDDYRPLTPEYKACSALLRRLSAVTPASIRSRALDEVMAHIRYEDETTEDIDIGPVNSVLNTLVHHFHSPGGADFTRGMRALEEYLWETGDEVRMQGYNSAQLWDAAFALQALHAARTVVSADVDDAVLVRAHRYIRENQLLDDPREHRRHYRHGARGGWTFSNRAQGWPVTDCTAEGVKAALIGIELGFGEPIGEARLHDAVRLILSWQNDDGGWATYELTRGGRWLERLNPSQVFGDIMIDYSVVECTSACIQALAEVRHRLPAAPAGTVEKVEKAIASGARFLTRAQRPDGSFEGSFGVCFTYGTWFGVSGLLAAGIPRHDKRIRRAAGFLRSVQKEDGSWGESPRSCSDRKYVQHPRGQVVMTAWAVLTLCRAGYALHPATEAGVRFLVDGQRPDGGYPAESYAGVFSRTTMINYDNYRHYFPLWAQARWLGCVGWFEETGADGGRHDEAPGHRPARPE
jgi:squalene/oxidosqualene cyclase-like protein